MSIQYEAKQEALKAYPNDRASAVGLFYRIIGVSISDFEYEEGMTAEEYLFARPEPPTDTIQKRNDPVV